MKTLNRSKFIAASGVFAHVTHRVSITRRLKTLILHVRGFVTIGISGYGSARNRSYALL